MFKKKLFKYINKAKFSVANTVICSLSVFFLFYLLSKMLSGTSIIGSEIYFSWMTALYLLVNYGVFFVQKRYLDNLSTSDSGAKKEISSKAFSSLMSKQFSPKKYVLSTLFNELRDEQRRFTEERIASKGLQ